MPIGSLSALGLIINDICKRKPETVLDLGCGTGMYGAAIRQWLNYGDPERFVETHIIGIEGFENYNNQMWEFYDNVYITDIREADIQGMIDCVLFCDVIEHMTKEEGINVIEKAKNALNNRGVLYVATPGVFIEQGAVYGNEFERHVSQWTEDDLKEIGFKIMSDGKTPDCLGQLMVVAKYIKW